MKPQSYKNTISRAVFFLLFISVYVGPLQAEPSDAKGCEVLYAEFLRKAQQALIEDHREEAVNFLLKAISIFDSCASIRQQPQFRNQGEESVLSLLSPPGLT